MRLVQLRELLILKILLLICYCECEYLRATTNSYNIGFENIQNGARNSSLPNQRHDIGFENVHNRLNNTSNRKPTHQVTTTPPRRPAKPKNTPTPKPNKVTSPPKPYVTTFRPSKPKVTTRPHAPRNTTTKPSISKPRPTVIPKKPIITTHKPLKPKFTTTTTPKPTRPTLPPSIYVKPNISKVIVPPANSIHWKPPPVGFQPNVITTTPSWNNTGVVQPTFPQPNQNYNDVDFGVFLMYLHDFTRKAEHNHQIKYKRYNGDQFNYYYEIYNYYNNGHLAAKNYRVPVDSLKNCQTNTSKVMCLPNTNAICLTNGTMMCVTHLSATIPCEDQTAYCAITYVPCDGRYQSCIGKNEPFYVGMPCVSRVILIPSTNDFYQQLTVSPIEYCVTSVINPKRLYSPVTSFMSMLVNTGGHYYNVIKNNTFSFANFLVK